MNSFNHDWHRYERRKQRRAWWLGFVGGLLAAAVLLWLAYPITTREWHLL